VEADYFWGGIAGWAKYSPAGVILSIVADKYEGKQMANKGEHIANRKRVVTKYGGTVVCFFY
jgi:hypothetical protein